MSEKGANMSHKSYQIPMGLTIQMMVVELSRGYGAMSGSQLQFNCLTMLISYVEFLSTAHISV